jgi:tetratricopeptide (TPR) repeat protein
MNRGQRLASVFAMLALPWLVGCAPLPATQIKRDMQTLQTEQTPDKLYERGQAFASIGDLTRAEQYLSAAIDAGGDAKKILPVLLRVCVEARRYRVAIDYAEGQLKKHPRDDQLRFLVANLYSAIDEPVRCRQLLEQLLAAHPNDAKLHYAMAVLLRDAQDDPVGADQHFRQYLRLNPNGPHAEEARGSLLKSVP